MTALDLATPAIPAIPAIAALSARLAAVAPALVADLQVDVPGAPDDGEPADREVAAVLLERLTAAVHADPTPDRVWLLLTAVAGRFPLIDTVEEARRSFALASPVECEVWLLDAAAAAMRSDDAVRGLRLVRSVVADVGATATDDLHTGIQRVVRSTMPRWVRDHAVELVGWWSAAAGWRGLDPDERDRVLRWGADPAPTGSTAATGPAPDTVAAELVVPWHAVVVLADTATAPQRPVLACMARFSGSTVVGVGYDCIPAVSAHLMPPDAAGVFMRYLEQVKHMHRLAAISESAAEEFRGFTSALPTQGVRGPDVVACVLGSDPVHVDAVSGGGRTATVLAVGSFEPRKNHLGLLHAAEVLWREGLDFRLELIGGMSWTSEIPARIEQLRAAGRPLRARRAVSDRELAAAYANARFTVFPSLHEGYGLPVVESFAHGVPVITSAHGATGEVASGGGALTVDVHDDDQLVAAMRMLLTDDEAVARLRREIAARQPRSWDDYAAELWELLVAPSLAR